jgi:hypothetical protein
MNDEFEDIQRLIRLKRHEKPGEGFTEELLARVNRRIQEDAAQKSSWELFWERTRAALESWMSPPQWAMAVAALILCGAGLWAYTVNSGSSDAPVQATTPANTAPKKDTLVGEEPKVKGKNPDGTAIPASHTGSPLQQQ